MSTNKNSDDEAVGNNDSREPMRFSNYMPVVIEYPKPARQELQPGIMYSYISSTFLNGWINYTGEIKRAWLIERYVDINDGDEPNDVTLAKWHADPPHHADLGKLGDDALLLTHDEYERWWFYWYDMDCSDCCIGMLDDIGDDDETVLGAFDAFVAERQRRIKPEGKALLIDPASIRGWKKG